MCIGIPMRVSELKPGYAVCIDRHGARSDIDLTLVGAVEPGQWLLTFCGAAREVLDERRARDIEQALAALEAIMRGDVTGIDAAFPDLVGREPQLPEFLR